MRQCYEAEQRKNATSQTGDGGGAEKTARIVYVPFTKGTTGHGNIRKEINVFRTVSKDEIREIERKRTQTRLESLLKDFIELNVECAELEEHEYTTSASGANSIRRAIKRLNLTGIDVVNVEGKILLFNHSAEDKA